MPPVSSVPSQRRQPSEAGPPVPAWNALQTDEITTFRAEGVTVDEKNKSCLADLSIPGAAVKLVCPSDCDLGLGIWYLDNIGEYSHRIAGRRSRHSDRGADDRSPICQKGDGNMVLVKQKSCRVKTAVHIIWGPVYSTRCWIGTRTLFGAAFVVTPVCLCRAADDDV